MTKRLILTIRGLVQGIGYRYASSEEANKRGFTGYVQNAADDAVTMVVEGSEQDLKDFIAWCYNGVGAAVVSHIEQQWSEPTGEFSDFVIRS